MEDKVMDTVKEGTNGGAKAVRLCPKNELGPQLRDFADTFSGFELLRETFKK
jgi:hypothetical protein